MAYETGVASSPADLLTKLAVFAAANGWTVQTPVSGRVFSNGNIYCGAESDANGFFLRGATGYDAGAAWNAQTGASNMESYCNTGAGPFTAYHFFEGIEDSAAYLNIVVEISAGVYRHGIICEIIKAGTWTGGTYVDSTFHDMTNTRANFPNSSYHRLICDTAQTDAPNGRFGSVLCTVVGTWHDVYDGSFLLYNAMGSIRQNGVLWNPINVGHARWNLRTILEPMWLFMNRGSGLRSPLGRIPNMRYLSMTHFSPGDIHDIGGDQWMIFPITARTTSQDVSPSVIPSTGLQGYAYRRDAT